MADKSYQIAFSGDAVDEDFYADVVSLRVEENTAMPSTMQLRLSTRQDDNGNWDYLEDSRLAPFTKVSVRIGFTGGGGLAGALGAIAGALGAGGSGDDGLERVFDGYISAIHFSLGSAPGDSHIEVSAMDTSVLMSLEEKIATWTDMSDSDIAQQVVSAYGVQAQMDSTPTVHQENDTTIVQRSTDIQFVRELAARNGLEFYFQTDKKSGNVTAFFRAPQLEGTPQPDLAIQFGGDSNLRSFSTRLNAQRPLSVKTQQIDVKANSANSAQVANVQLAKLGDKDANTLLGGALDSLVTPKDTQAQMLALGPPTSDATELQTIAQAVRDEAGWFITAEGEINTEAYQAVLRAHRLVLVKGSGTPYSGKYYVTRVVHELKGDGTYTQKFEARRNARDIDGTEQFGGGGGLGLPIPGL
jgi:phage protein D